MTLEGTGRYHRFCIIGFFLMIGRALRVLSRKIGTEELPLESKEGAISIPAKACDSSAVGGGF